MNAPEQIGLFEPTGEEVVRLVREYVARAEKLFKAAEDLSVRGFNTAAAHYDREAWDAANEAACLEMLALFERLGGVQ